MKMQAAAVLVVPKAAKARVSVAYSPERLPDPRTVLQPLEVLERAVLLGSSAFGKTAASLTQIKLSAAEKTLMSFIVE